uniref:Peptidase A1 domain-containing protein n=1 Tax=Trichobilharzia regenti TaxID=157069 RepID=A0AA85JQQ5_TRIRE|nr:unnamed protein product [Trichobilharzia regenti]
MKIVLQLIVIFRVYYIVVTYSSTNALNEDVKKSYLIYNLSGQPGQGYYITLYAGTPEQTVNLLVDTGSSNIAIAGVNLTNVDNWFKPNQSSTLQCSDTIQNVRYEKGYWYGVDCQDYFHFADHQKTMLPSTAIHNYRIPLSFGLIFNSTKLFLKHSHSTWYGIIGLGFTSLFVKPHRITNHSQEERTAIFTQLKIQPTKAKISQPISYLDKLNQFWKISKQFGLLLCGTTLNKNQALNSRQMSGKLLIGQMNLSLLLPSDSSSSSSTSLSSGLKMNNFKASNTYFTPIRKPWYYEIILTNLIVGNMSLVVNCKELNVDKTIIDSGTTNIYLPKNIFHRLVDVMKVKVNENPALAELASKTSFWHGKRAYCLSVTTEDSKLQLYKSFPQIEFHLVSSINTSNQILSLTFSPQQYVRYLGQISQHNQSRSCFAFAIQPTHKYSILGSVFLEAYYTTFDHEKMQIGFSNSPCNAYTNNPNHLVVSKVNGLKHWNHTPHKLASKTNKIITKRSVIQSPLDCAVYTPTTDEQFALITNILTSTIWSSLCLYAVLIPLLILLNIKFF